MKNTMNPFVVIALLAALMAGSATATRGRPNVVLIITDDQGYGDLSCHGNPVLKTPNLDRLYDESVRLVDYHVAPTCSPTRAALVTGHWTNRTGVWHTSGGGVCFGRTRSPWARSPTTPATPRECSASGTWATTTPSGPRIAASAK